MSKYLREGYLYFPPITIGGASGDYVTTCPVMSCEEAEFEILSVATTDTATPMVLVTGDSKPKQLPYDGSIQIGLISGTDGGSQAFPGVAMAWGGANIPAPPVGEFFPITDSQRRIFARIDCAGGKSVYVSLRYRVRPIRSVVDRVETHDTERSYNAASAEVVRHLNAETIQKRGEAVNL